MILSLRTFILTTHQASLIVVARVLLVRLLSLTVDDGVVGGYDWGD